jgi:hypothetical protein
MTCVQRVAAALAVSGALPLVTYAQAPPSQPGVRSSAASGSGSQGQATARPRRRSVVHHYPYPYPDYYHGDQTAGFRNPGGVGRYLEYYPAGNQFQESNDPVRVAHFDTGFGNRQEQLQSLQVGVQRDNAIMNHIDRMARPAFGVGFFGGFY